MFSLHQILSHYPHHAHRCMKLRPGFVDRCDKVNICRAAAVVDFSAWCALACPVLVMRGSPCPFSGRTTPQPNRSKHIAQQQTKHQAANK
jgi:hypothetical protein